MSSSSSRHRDNCYHQECNGTGNVQISSTFMAFGMEGVPVQNAEETILLYAVLWLCMCLSSWSQDACRHNVHSREACRAVSSRQLIPGDVIVVLPGKATCDMVLLQGNCLVEESNLSGEVIASHQVCCLQQRVTA